MGMKKESLLLVPLLMLLLPMSFGVSMMVSVRGLASIGKTEHTFICATIDWWPKAKCNYGQCPWGHTSLLNMDLTNPILPKAIEAFGTLKIRIGGSLEDQIYYKVGKFAKGCPNLKLSPKGLFGFSHGCLHMARWDKAYNLLHQSKAKITFGLNALIGRKKLTENSLYGGDRDSSNARDFMKHILSKGQHIEAWELGNELFGSGVSARVDVKQYAKDVIELKGLVTKLFQNSSSPGKVLALGGFFDKEWYSQLLLLSGPNIIDGVTHHIYNHGPGLDPNLLSRMQDPYYFDNAVQTFQDLQTTLKSFGPWSLAWVGEAGGAYNSGGKHVSHNFVNKFWYLDQLGMAAAFDTKFLIINNESLDDDEIKDLEKGASSDKSELTVENIGDDRKSRSREKAREKGHKAIALSIMAVAGGRLINFPTVAIPEEEAFYKLVFKSFPFLSLASFFLALFSLLISSRMIPNAHKFGASVALKLAWLGLAMELVALIIVASLLAII